LLAMVAGPWQLNSNFQVTAILSVCKLLFFHYKPHLMSFLKNRLDTV